MQDLKELYYIIKKNIDRIDFDSLWEGFKKLKFALYNDKECFFDGEYIEKTNEFIANTAINYHGEVIAIWNVMEDVDLITLTSKIVHEMFHGYQMINNESRFPDELDALYNYQYDDNNLSTKLAENKMLVILLDNFTARDYNRFLGLRSSRLKNNHYEYVYESKIEQIEGSANYVELMALKKLSYYAYLRKLSELKERITSKNNFFPIRVLCYDIGALLILLLNQNNIPFDLGFSEDSFSLTLVKNYKNIVNLDFLLFSKEIEDYYNHASDIINKAIEKNDVVIDEECDILGVNVYNAIYYKNYIISIYFVMVGNMDSPRIEYGNFVIETLNYKKASKIYRY